MQDRPAQAFDPPLQIKNSPDRQHFRELALKGIDRRGEDQPDRRGDRFIGHSPEDLVALELSRLDGGTDGQEAWKEFVLVFGMNGTDRARDGEFEMIAAISVRLKYRLRLEAQRDRGLYISCQLLVQEIKIGVRNGLKIKLVLLGKALLHRLGFSFHPGLAHPTIIGASGDFTSVGWLRRISRLILDAA
jgi:hypothetical protein